MIYGYWRAGMAGREACFDMSFRASPFGGGYAIACGLAYFVDHLNAFGFTGDDIAFLRSLRGADGARVFDPAFLDWLRGWRFECSVDAAPEGTVVFAREPLVRVIGPLAQCQALESALLNMINFQTLIATKAARICLAARGDPVIEFGLRRAQGIDGGLAASRAAYVGGCAATSNTLAAKLFGIPARGTHAHSWVMAFGDELDAFRAYAAAMPGNSIFLVDTYRTMNGVRNAIRAAKELRARGHEIAGIRLDSGDLARLAAGARRLLDRAGFRRAAILASGDLDEHAISRLKKRRAAINAWGVGTRLVTAHGDSALGGVYKLAAIRGPGGGWEWRVKLSDDAAKMSTPGVLQVRRFIRNGRFIADAVYDEETGVPTPCTIVSAGGTARRRTIPRGTAYRDLLVPVFVRGRQTCAIPSPAEARSRAQQQLAALPPGVKRLAAPGGYPAGIERRLHDLRAALVRRAERVQQREAAC